MTISFNEGTIDSNFKRFNLSMIETNTELIMNNF